MPSDDAATIDRPPTVGRYQIRVGATTVPADGYSWIPVLVTGTSADESPALDSLTLSVSRAGSGIVRPANISLTASGGSTFFVPCSHADPGCLGGAVRIQARLALSPGSVVAESEDIILTVPDGLGSPAACLGGANVMFFDGNDFIYTGVMTITAATFTADEVRPDRLGLGVKPEDPQAQGTGWTFYFSSEKLGENLEPGVYRNAQRYPFMDSGRPGLTISGDGRGCNTSLGDFQIHTIDWTSDRLVEFVATFEQHCGGIDNSLRGCLHYTSPYTSP